MLRRIEIIFRRNMVAIKFIVGKNEGLTLSGVMLLTLVGKRIGGFDLIVVVVTALLVILVIAHFCSKRSF